MVFAYGRHGSVFRSVPRWSCTTPCGDDSPDAQAAPATHHSGDGLTETRVEWTFTPPHRVDDSDASQAIGKSIYPSRVE